MAGRDAEAAEQDYELFMQELEADKEMRSTVNLYKREIAASKKSASGGASKLGGSGAAKMGGGIGATGGEMVEDEVDLDEEEVRLDELLDEMTLAPSVEAALGAVGGLEKQVLTADQAATVPAIPLPTNGFDAADLGAATFHFK